MTGRTSNGDVVEVTFSKAVAWAMGVISSVLVLVLLGVITTGVAAWVQLQIAISDIGELKADVDKIEAKLGIP